MIRGKKRRKHKRQEYFAVSTSENDFDSSGGESEGDMDFDSGSDMSLSGSPRNYAKNLRGMSVMDGFWRTVFLLSIAGIIFLSIIMSMLVSDSPYLKVSAEVAHSKPDLARGVLGAIIMYVITACLTYSPTGTGRLLVSARQQLEKLKREDG